MLDFSKFSKTETTELMEIMHKNIEKSDLERYYIFSQDNKEKAKIFIWCHRFLNNAYNLLDNDSPLRKPIKEEIDLTRAKFLEIKELLLQIQYAKIFYHRLDIQLFNALNDPIVNDLIDAFSVFLEREIILNMSKLKGFNLEGKSGQEVKKIFATKTQDEQPMPEEEELTEHIKETEPDEKEIKEDEEND